MSNHTDRFHFRSWFACSLHYLSILKVLKIKKIIAQGNCRETRRSNKGRDEYDLLIPSHVALVAHDGTSGRALADRERVQQVRETILHQLVYYETAIVVDGREDERSAKVKRPLKVSSSIDQLLVNVTPYVRGRKRRRGREKGGNICKRI